MPNLKSQSGIIPLVVLAIVGTVSASGVTVVASQKSIPGDALYPVKQVTENVRVAAAFSKIDKAKVHLSIAEEKVKEIEKLEEKGKIDKIAEAAQNLEESQDQALELTQSVKSEGENVDELVELLEVQSNRQQVVITRISPKITVQVRESLLKSLEQFREELKVTIESEEAEQEEAGSNQNPCPSPSPSEDEDSDQEDENNDQEEEDTRYRKYEDVDVEGVSLSFEDRGFRQLRNSQNSSFSRDPCDSNERSSEGGSSTFDGGATSGDIEGGTDAAGGDQGGEPATAPTSTAPGVEGVSTTGGLLQLILNALFPLQKR